MRTHAIRLRRVHDFVSSIFDSRERAHSLLNQGLFYVDCLPNVRDERAKPLMAKFDELVLQHATFREAFGLV